jgi:large subunit ribosomal protein L24e
MYSHSGFRVLFLSAFAFYITNMDVISNYPSLSCREIKERIKKTKDEKKAKKAEVASKAQKSGKGNVQKGAMPKGPKIGGGGGKR